MQHFPQCSACCPPALTSCTVQPIHYLVGSLSSFQSPTTGAAAGQLPPLVKVPLPSLRRGLLHLDITATTGKHKAWPATARHDGNHTPSQVQEYAVHQCLKANCACSCHPKVGPPHTPSPQRTSPAAAVPRAPRRLRILLIHRGPQQLKSHCRLTAAQVPALNVASSREKHDRRAATTHSK